jgi:hypothetical protein
VDTIVATSGKQSSGTIVVVLVAVVAVIVVIVAGVVATRQWSRSRAVHLACVVDEPSELLSLEWDDNIETSIVAAPTTTDLDWDNLDLEC